MIKKLKSVVFISMILVALLLVVGCRKESKIKIVVDGGGQQGHYNSTLSMDYDAVANPYPYNTLEKLAEEWEKSHPKYDIEIARNSLNNDREKLVSSLSQKTAPDILFYLGTTIAEDMNKGWFVEMNDYLQKPNPYSKAGQLGSEKWMDIYDPEEIKTTMAPNGKYLTVSIDKAPIGIIYNKDLFEKAGITNIPETFGEFMDAQDKLYQYGVSSGLNTDSDPENDIQPYFPLYYWYDIVLEGSLFSNFMTETGNIDVIDRDGLLKSEELVRAYKLGLFKLDSPEFKELLRIVRELTKYYPEGYESYYAESYFVKGQVGMLEAHSGQMMKINKDQLKDFEVGTFPYPKLTSDDTSANPGNYYVRRGTAGLTTGWAVTNTAIEKGQETVDAAVDFLMYVTAPDNNDKMVNDLGFAVPLSGNSTNPLYDGLVAKYKEDMQNPKAKAWQVFCHWGVMNKEYYDAYINTRKVLVSGKVNGKEVTEEELFKYVTDQLTIAMEVGTNKLMRQNNWALDNWQ